MLSSGAGNTYMGYQSGYGDASTNDGTYNTAVGYEALLYSAGDYNTAIGFEALQGSSRSFTGVQNTGVGYRAGFEMDYGSYNTYLGTLAGSGRSSGSYNVGIGKDHTLFALKDGKVEFKKGRNNRSFVSVVENS